VAQFLLENEQAHISDEKLREYVKLAAVPYFTSVQKITTNPARPSSSSSSLSDPRARAALSSSSLSDPRARAVSSSSSTAQRRAPPQTDEWRVADRTKYMTYNVACSNVGSAFPSLPNSLSGYGV